MKSLTSKKFYELVARERDARGWDNKKMCKHLGITEASLSRWKHDRAKVSIELYFAILSKLGYKLKPNGEVYKCTK